MPLGQMCDREEDKGEIEDKRRRRKKENNGKLKKKQMKRTMR